MPGYIGLQLALELSNVLPVKEYAHAAFRQVINFASQLRRSGSDIVVEENLADLFGRGHMSFALEQEFKSCGQAQSITPLYKNSDIELRNGPGPTMLRAFKEKERKEYIATVVTLSMLGYFQNPENLAAMIDWTMNKRVEANLPNSSASLGYESVLNTLQACISQSSQFLWKPYVDAIESKLRSVITNYQHHPDYMRLSPTVFLGAIDFLFAVQRLPENRKVTVSNESGCIPLIIWAHYILELTVTIKGGPIGDVVFGESREAQLFIEWNGAEKERLGELLWPFESDEMDPIIRLHDADMSVILAVEPNEEDSLTSHVEERHPLSGYGSTYLLRVLNVDSVISTTDPVFGEAVKFIIGVALHWSNMMSRNMNYNELNEGIEGQPIELENWRIIASGKLLFSGIIVDEAGAESYRQYYSKVPLTEKDLPQTFNAFLAKVKKCRSARSSADRLLDQVLHLVKIVLLFAHVSELEKCSYMPLILTKDHVQLSPFVRSIAAEPLKRGFISPHDVFHGIVSLLSSTVLDSSDDDPKFSSRSRFLFLCSDRGWSVYLNTVGEQDPGKVRPELIQVSPGVPTNKKTNERKSKIRDGVGYIKRGYPDCYLLVAGTDFIPRSVAKIQDRKEFWVSKSQEFELRIHSLMSLAEEWQSEAAIDAIEVLYGYREMQDDLWQLKKPPECEHSMFLNSKSDIPARVKVGPDAAPLLGWSCAEDILNPFPQRVIICLTYGDPQVRWAAVQSAVTKISVKSTDRKESDRDAMLRTNDCCVKCALSHVISLSGRWILIL